MKVRITESLDIELEIEQWQCNRCGHGLGPATADYKHGCLVAEVPIEEAHPPMTAGETFSFAPDPDYCRLVEFYCPDCGTLIENEYLPPGHPLTHDIELDIAALKARHGVA